MLKTCMICTGVNQIREAQLPYPSKPLYLRRFDQRKRKFVKFNIIMYRVANYFHRYELVDSGFHLLVFSLRVKPSSMRTFRIIFLTIEARFTARLASSPVTISSTPG